MFSKTQIFKSLKMLELFHNLVKPEARYSLFWGLAAKAGCKPGDLGPLPPAVALSHRRRLGGLATQRNLGQGVHFEAAFIEHASRKTEKTGVTSKTTEGRGRRQVPESLLLESSRRCGPGRGTSLSG